MTTNHLSSEVISNKILTPPKVGKNVVGGYKKQMEDFMNFNEGIRRSFRINFVLKDYNSKQLTDILIHFMYEHSTSLKITPRDADILFNIVDKLNDVKVFDKQAGICKI